MRVRRGRPYLFMGESAPSVTYLSDTVNDVVFELSATQDDSYTGSGVTWSNREASPADSASQTAYDLYTGDGSTSSTYPTFSGTAGDSGALWTLDGGDYFDIKPGANTTFLQNMHKTTGGSDFTFFISLKYQTSAGAQVLMATNTTATGAGVRITLNAALGNKVWLQQRGSSTSSVTSTAALSDNTYYIIGVSHSHSGNNTRMWINSVTAENLSHTFSTTTTNANAPMVLGSAGNHAGNLEVSSEIIHFIGLNAYIDNTTAETIMNYIAGKETGGRYGFL